MNVKDCLNCDHPLVANQNFCANCGQTTKLHRFKLGHFFHEFFHAFTHADKGVIYLLKELAIKPGVVAREYIAGKRKKYFNPFTFFLLLAAFFVLSNSLSNSLTKKPERSIPSWITSVKDSKEREKRLEMYHRIAKSKEFTSKSGNIMAMIAVPFFAFIFWVIYFRKPYNYAEHLVANLMFVSFANLAFSIVVNPIQLLLGKSPWATFVPLLGFILQLIYYSVAYTGFMKLKGFWPILKVILSSLLALISWIFITLTAMAIYVYQNSHFYEYFKHMGGR